MNTYHNLAHSEHVPTNAIQLGEHIRAARKAKGWTIANLAERVGRPREWLNRIELGHSSYGEHRPASVADLRSLLPHLEGALEVSAAELQRLGVAAEADFAKLRLTTRTKARRSVGKLTQAEIIMGEDAVVEALLYLISEQQSDAVVRNIGIRGQGSYTRRTNEWNRYREALGAFLAGNPNAIFKRVEYVANNSYLASSKSSDERLRADGELKDVHNAKVKFRKQNPLSLHLLIGQREAILALPRSSGQPGSNMALLVHDRVFVEALRLWYDEVLWDGPDQSVMVDYTRFDDSFEEIKKMYGYTD